MADLLVFVGAAVCLFHIEWRTALHLKRFLRGIVWYQAVLLLVVVAHPFKGDIIEWFHRFSYLAGSTLVGWVIATHGRVRQAFRLYLWGAAVLALLGHRARRVLPLPAGPVGRLPEEHDRRRHVGGRGHRTAEPALGPYPQG